MKDLACTNTAGDLRVVDRDLVFTSGLEEFAQRALDRLETQRGTWFTDTAHGVDHRELMTRRGVQVSDVRGEIMRVIGTMRGFRRFRSIDLQLDREARELFGTLTIETTFGTTTISPTFTTALE